MKRMMEKVRRVVISLLCILMLTSHFTPVMSSDPMDETEAFETQVQEIEDEDVQDIEHEDLQEIDDDDVLAEEHEDSQEIKDEEFQAEEHEDSQEIKDEEFQAEEHEDSQEIKDEEFQNGVDEDIQEDEVIDNEFVIKLNSTGPVSTTGHPLQFGREYHMYNLEAGRSAGRVGIHLTGTAGMNDGRFRLRSDYPSHRTIYFSRGRNPQSEVGTINFGDNLNISILDNFIGLRLWTFMHVVGSTIRERGNESTSFGLQLGQDGRGFSFQQNGANQWIGLDGTLLVMQNQRVASTNWEFIPVITHNLTVSSSSGGNASSERNVLEPDQVINITATPNTGYRFIRWEVTGAGSRVGNTTNAQTTFTMGTGPATVRAVFESFTQSHLVTVTHTEGGQLVGGQNQTFQLEEGRISSLPNASAVDAHHRFVGWQFVGNTNGARITLPSSQSFATITMGTGPVTVQAVFERITHPLTVTHTDGGTISGGSQTVDIGQGTEYRLPSLTTVAAGHRFARWEFVGDAIGATLQNATNVAAATVTMGTGPATVQAVFERITHSLAVSHTEGGTIAGGNHQTIIVGQGTVHDLPTANPTADHRFIRWEFVGVANGATLQNPTSQNNATITMGTGPATLQAVFERITHPLTVTHTEGGTVDGEDNQTFQVGQGVAYALPTATTTAHHRFIRWEFVGVANGATLQNATSQNNATITMGTGPATLQAVFERITHPLTVTHTEGGTVDGEDNQTFQVGQGVAYALPTATTTAHHRFIGWEFVGNANGATLQNATSQNNATLTMGTGPATVQAVFERITHPLTVTHTEGGTVDGEDNQTFQVGQGVAYALPTATPTAHHRFIRWEFVGNANGATLQNATSQNNATLTMGTGPATVQAVFERITHPLTVTHTEGGTVDGEDNQTFQVGQGVAYALPTATPTDHHRFIRWEFVGVANGATLQNATSQNNATITMGTGPATVQAVFERITHPLTVTHTEGGTVDGEDNQTFQVGQGVAYALPTATPTAHHRFIGWEFVGVANGATLQNPTRQNNATITMGTGPATVQAVFERITHPLTVTHTEGGTVDGGIQTIDVGQGTDFALPNASVADADHRFVRWEFVGVANGATLQNPTSQNNATITMGTGPATVQAIFDRIAHSDDASNNEEDDNQNQGNLPHTGTATNGNLLLFGFGTSLIATGVVMSLKRYLNKRH